jgi:hypothetical protein
LSGFARFALSGIESQFKEYCKREPEPGLKKTGEIIGFIPPVNLNLNLTST